MIMAYLPIQNAGENYQLIRHISPLDCNFIMVVGKCQHQIAIIYYYLVIFGIHFLGGAAISK
jgi:hypothetical protein